MTLNNLLADGETDTYSFEFFFPMESLKRLKDFFKILRLLKSDSIILHTDLIAPFFLVELLGWTRIDFDMRRRIGALKFQGIADEILKELNHLARITLHDGQVMHFHMSAFILNQYLQVRNGLLDRCI